MFKENTLSSKIIIVTIAVGLCIFSILLVKVLIDVANKHIRVKEENVGSISGYDNRVEENVVQENVTNETIVENANETLSKSFGRVEVIWVDNQNKIISKPQAPTLNGMTPVKFKKGDTFIETTANDSEWYNYEEKLWANATDANGSYFVWIPRFAYKIVYYNDATYNKPIGYSDARGVVKINDNGTLTRITKNNVGLQEVGNHYILHPAFMKDIATGYRNGGWDSNISGIWVAKYEMSMEDQGNNSDTKTESIGNIKISDKIKAVSKPGVIAWRRISIGTSYYNSLNYNKEAESHLMKNSEWGAISYLAFSKYGRNTQKVETNKSRNNYTGGTNLVNDIYNYNGTQTTTGNATGIYDLAGNLWEFTACFINNGYKGIQQYGGIDTEYLLETTTNTKYKTVYNNSSTDNGNDEYNRKYALSNFEANSGFRGDAIFEISTNPYASSTWESGSSFYMQQDTPFLIRGSDLSTTNSSMFAYHGSSGQPDTTTGYRVVIPGK